MTKSLTEKALATEARSAQRIFNKLFSSVSSVSLWQKIYIEGKRSV